MNSEAVEAIRDLLQEFREGLDPFMPQHEKSRALALITGVENILEGERVVEHQREHQK